jgi:DNA-binding response OmpR family regulator
MSERPIVLIAEDEAPIAEALAYLVDEVGYTAVIAAHGKEALVLARAVRPRLIITDLMMPHLDGAELIAALRADAATAGSQPPPVILMTAAPPSTRAANADAFLHKPFDIDEVEVLLRRFLESPEVAPGDSRDVGNGSDGSGGAPVP